MNLRLSPTLRNNRDSQRVRTLLKPGNLYREAGVVISGYPGVCLRDTRMRQPNCSARGILPVHCRSDLRDA